MQKLTVFALAAALLGSAGLSAQQPNAIQRASTLLGAGTVKTIQFVGTGQNFSVGQNYTSSDPWPAVPVKSYTATINYDTGSMRVELLRTMGPVMPRGGGAPFTGEQRQTQVVSGNYAWNVPVAPAGGAAPAAQPQAAAQSERMLALWATPQGFVKAAMANNATTQIGRAHV